MRTITVALTVLVGCVVTFQNLSASDAGVNQTPYIPPQCYTKTAGEGDTIHNSCYTCHTRSGFPNLSEI
jgi:hypothetical protein